MPRQPVQQPTLNEHGDERHPAWGMIGASRVQNGPPGATLFDSDIRHQHTVRIALGTASRSRDLGHDHLMRRGQFLEVEMSEAQWASFVSSMNSGDGVPCTIRQRERDPMPEVPYEPRLAESLAETRAAAGKAAAAVSRAFVAYEEHKNAENLRNLKYAIQNMTPNVAYAAKTLSEHAENVVQRARADVEAMVVSKAQQLGIEPGELGMTMQLESGDGISSERLPDRAGGTQQTAVE